MTKNNHKTQQIDLKRPAISTLYDNVRLGVARASRLAMFAQHVPCEVSSQSLASRVSELASLILELQFAVYGMAVSGGAKHAPYSRGERLAAGILEPELSPEFRNKNLASSCLGRLLGGVFSPEPGDEPTFTKDKDANTFYLPNGVHPSLLSRTYRLLAKIPDVVHEAVEAALRGEKYLARSLSETVRGGVQGVLGRLEPKKGKDAAKKKASLRRPVRIIKRSRA